MQTYRTMRMPSLPAQYVRILPRIRQVDRSSLGTREYTIDAGVLEGIRTVKIRSGRRSKQIRTVIDPGNKEAIIYINLCNTFEFMTRLTVAR